MAEERAALSAELASERMVPVFLDDAEITGFYDRIANGVLWPLFHYLPAQLPHDIQDWPAYERANARVAEVVAEVYAPGDTIWVHDYHLMLVPALLRERLPEARIGYFLHIPFPSSEVFRTLPFRERLLEGLLGADLVGFHTAAYARHFMTALLRLLGLAARVDRVQTGEREVAIGVFPMGVDAAHWAALGGDRETEAAVEAVRGDDGCALVVGIDRLDYTKGIPRRLLAFERLLEGHPELRERVRLVQLAVPSRGDVPAYREFRTQIESLVGRVNGRFGTARWTPIHYLHRQVAEPEVAALYRAADVMLVTPERDGMNLVSKEFVACRADEGGVLVLSEFTGAAAELAEALHVNPYDVGRTADTLHRALTLPDDERRARMRALRRRVTSYDVGRWARSFLDAVDVAVGRRRPPTVALTPGEAVAEVVERLRAEPALVLLLDYDGTLVPFADVPDLAWPDRTLLELLERLARRPGTAVHVVSGRLRETMARWLGHLPIGLHAEHGLWSRGPGGEWAALAVEPGAWLERARHILEEFRARTPGSLVEEKTMALAWHYRMADPEFGAHQANELRLHLGDLFSNEPVEVLTGEKVIELRPHGLNKGRIVDAALAEAPAGALAVAMGDDRTDEDLFVALPPSGLAIHVGASPSHAGVRVRDWRAVRDLLVRLAANTDAVVRSTRGRTVAP
jgi:trehalose 6-phosphate synthase/phosphatase